MNFWFVKPTIKDLNDLCARSMVEYLSIEFITVGDDYLEAKMPVDWRTQQPDGLLHGGASVVLAETLGSVAANLCVDRTKYVCVGQEINANHIRPKRDGWITGTTKAIHLGKTTQIWEITINDERNKLICISRLTMAVIKK